MNETEKEIQSFLEHQESIARYIDEELTRLETLVEKTKKDFSNYMKKTLDNL